MEVWANGLAFEYVKYAAVGVVAYFLLRNWLTAASSSIPGPFPVPVFGNILSLTSQPWFKFAHWHDVYGKIYRFFVWNKLMIAVQDPEDVKAILQTSRELYPKDDWSYTFFKPILGHGLVTSEGEVWKKHRAVMRPVFEFEALQRLLPVFIGAADRLMKRWAPQLQAGKQPTVELGLTFRTVTLEVIAEVALGWSPEDASVLPRMFEEVLDELNLRMFKPWRAFMPLEIAHRRRLRELNEMVLQIIRARRAGHADGTYVIQSADEASASSGKTYKASELGGDMLDMLLMSGADMSDHQLMDELKTMLLAGHETSSMMMLWSCYLLAKHPEALHKARAEVDAAIGTDPTKWGSFDDYKDLKYLEWVMFEAMRLYCPVPVLSRYTLEDVILEGKLVPAASTVILSVWSMHRSKKVWGADADEFRPERFSPEESRSRHPFAYLPFSLGPRNCIGRNLAIMEGKVVLATILQRFSLSVTPGQPHDIPTDCYVIPVRPEGGLYMNIRPRK